MLHHPSPKRSHKAGWSRNHNAKKRRAYIQKRAFVNNWICSTVEGKQLKHASLCAVIHPSTEPKPQKTEKPKKQENIVHEPQPSSSKVTEQPKKEQQSKQGKEAKENAKNQKSGKVNQPKVEEKESNNVEQSVHKSEPSSQPKEKPKNKKSNQKKESNQVEPPAQKTQINAQTSENTKGKKSGKKNEKREKKDSETSQKSTVIKAEVEEFGADHKKRLSEELVVDVTTNGMLSANDSNLTKCSMDSGVDMTNGTDSFGREQHRSGSNTNSVGQESNEDKTLMEEKNSEESGITRFAHSVQQFVSQVQEKIFTEPTQQVITSTSYEPAKANLHQALKIDYSDLKKAPSVSSLTDSPRHRRPRVYKLLEKDIEYCTYMVDNYGQNYQAMCDDPKNVYMDDASSIARKIRVFKEYMNSVKA
ncbi:ribosome biogenesis protein nop16 domain-containing protein [Ditylenchus destructor]|nr:ribosome biogenesis protein nop16 domain-containing protein [Ditylenchus destructor]